MLKITHKYVPLQIVSMKIECFILIGDNVAEFKRFSSINRSRKATTSRMSRRLSRALSNVSAANRAVEDIKVPFFYYIIIEVLKHSSAKFAQRYMEIFSFFFSAISISANCFIAHCCHIPNYFS